MKESTGIGKTCKIAAIVILFIGLIGSLVIAQPSELARAFGNGGFNFSLFLGSFGIVGVFCMQLFALGEIVDYLASIHERETEIVSQLCAAMQKDAVSAYQTVEAASSAPPTAQSTTIHTAHGEVTPEGDIICSACGRRQKADRTVCWECGAKFED